MLSKSISVIIEKLQASYGEAFFNTMTLQLHQVIDADYTFIARLSRASKSARTISLVAHGEVVDNFEYELADTPCADVSEGSVCVYLSDICRLFPDDQLLIDMGIEGYVGTPLYDSEGSVLGLVVALYQNPIANSDDVKALFTLFSGRISAEIERFEKEQQLIQFNQNLEQQVAQRTAELTATLEELKASQQQMIEHEKMASIGRLVAGIAHEINTPLGVALLSNSTINQSLQDLQREVESNNLTRKTLAKSLQVISEAQQTQQFNMQRAADLVQNFKQVSAEHYADKLAKIDLQQWLNTVVASLKPLMDQHQISIQLSCQPANIEMTTFPGQLAQIVINLLTNAAQHAFPAEQITASPTINIAAHQTAEHIHLIVQDNGVGMPEATLGQVCEPFFTTKRGRGGTGLGMSIVNNLVRNSLQGSLSIDSAMSHGTRIAISLPEKIKE
ncbi:HAMP domain-containing histidine kinase [Neiella sp. HB171785]|uniref:histidine kinase n=1 Tax=Neiella litorisoli TaxID=2771431 RepID=A0A8J6QSR9_9GAMM|nr:HAMP domain-containing sensor histidine kinase [Neiella litorisoli]MBD1388027.1 HAMP domain-containing histidine kinase [Neiella litorisoli]